MFLFAIVSLLCAAQCELYQRIMGIYYLVLRTTICIHICFCICIYSSHQSRMMGVNNARLKTVALGIRKTSSTRPGRAAWLQTFKWVHPLHISLPLNTWQKTKETKKSQHVTSSVDLLAENIIGHIVCLKYGLYFYIHNWIILYILY